MSPEASGLVYSLPVKPLICPASLAAWITASAAVKSSAVTVPRFLPCSISTSPTVSRISVSMLTLPLEGPVLKLAGSVGMTDFTFGLLLP